MRAKSGTDELIAFVGARLAETAEQADLFHEPACTAVALREPGPGTAVLEGCACPVPREIRDRALALRSELDTCATGSAVRTREIPSGRWTLSSPNRLSMSSRCPSNCTTSGRTRGFPADTNVSPAGWKSAEYPRRTAPSSSAPVPYPPVERLTVPALRQVTTSRSVLAARETRRRGT